MIKTYKDLIDYKFIHNGNIPKIIFRTGKYKVEDLPKEVLDLYDNEMRSNADYTLFYFDDKDVDNFVILEYGILMFDCMSKLIPKAFQADFWRYLVLYKYGGIYLDFTMHTLVPFDEIIKDHKEVYVRDTCDLCGIYNAFIGVIPNAKLLKKAIDKVIENIKNKYKGVNALDVTGPTMFGRIFKQELNLYFYDWIPLGEMSDGIYLYSNPSNKYIVDGDKHIIKNRLDNHYELAYNEKPHPLVPEMKPLNHYSRLWCDDKIYKS
jgi:mannosyltransferase OCH1-like enzyme